MTGQVLLAATREGIFQPDNHVGGLYRSTDGGELWVRLTGTGNLPEAAVSNIAADPSSDTALLCCGPGHGVFRSEDVGATCRTLPTTLLRCCPVDALNDSVRIHLSVSPAGNHPVLTRFNPVAHIPGRQRQRTGAVDSRAVVSEVGNLDGTDNNGTGGIDDAGEAVWRRVADAPIANAGGQGRFTLRYWQTTSAQTSSCWW